MNSPVDVDAASDEVEITGRVFRSARDIADALVDYRRRQPQRSESAPTTDRCDKKSS